MPTIVTLTMNPALDITTAAGALTPTDKVRCESPRRDPGGGGINVARILTILGDSVTAVFPAGGHTGRALEDLVVTEGVGIRTITIRGSTRESFTVNERQTGLQYRFVLPGPEMTCLEQESSLELLAETAAEAEFVVASGSLPPGVPPDFCQRIADIVADVGARFVVDTSGPALQHLSHGIFLLKPSIRELRERMGRELRSLGEQVAAARELIDTGVCSVVVLSLGANGAVHVTAHEDAYCPSVEVPVVSGVGAGDSMVAGITHGLVRGWPLSETVRYGVAAGAAMLGTPGTALCRRTEIERYFTQLTERIGETGSTEAADTVVG